jgi:osmotically-inducible protein OsmY
MTRIQKWSTAIAATALAATAVTTMVVRHQNSSATVPNRPPATADVLNNTSQISDDAIVSAIQQTNAPIASLSARNVGGIVVLRGAGDAAASARAVAAVKSLGFTRVANLITPTTPIDDEAIRRDAERHLAQMRSLDGCLLKVSCTNGVLNVSGTVQSELQIDAARSALRSLHGPQKIELAVAQLPRS